MQLDIKNKTKELIWLGEYLEIFVCFVLRLQQNTLTLFNSFHTSCVFVSGRVSAAGSKH